MTVLRNTAIAILLSLGLAACDSSRLGLNTVQTEEELEVTITNRTASEIVYTETIFTGWMQPDDDIVLVFERDGKFHDACANLDLVPIGRMTLAPGEEFSFTASINQLSMLFCLDAGQEYQLRALHVARDGDGYRVIDRSNTRPMTALPGPRFTRLARYRISPDGARFEVSTAPAPSGSR